MEYHPKKVSFPALILGLLSIPYLPAPGAAQVQVIARAAYDGPAPLAVAVDGAGTVYLPDLRAGITYRFDPSLQPLAAIPSPGGLHLHNAIAWSPASGHLHWFDATDSALIETALDGSIVSTHPLAIPQPDSTVAAMTADGAAGTLWCLDPVHDEVFEVALDGIRTVRAAIPLPSGADSFGLGIAWVPDGGDHPLEALCGPGSSWRAGALVRFGPGGPLACSDRDVGLLAAFPGSIARNPSRAGSYYLVDNGGLEILEVEVDGSAAVCPPADLRCTAGAGSVELVWTPGPYTAIDVLRDGVEVAALDGSAARWEDPAPPAGHEVLYEVAGRSGDLRSCPAACAVTPPQVVRPALPISDAAGNSMADAPDILFSAIGAGGAPLTFAAGDGDDGSVEVAIGFPFPFFGSLQSNVTVGVNGLLVFGGAARQPANTDLPSPRLPDGLIAPFWDDLDASAPLSAVLIRLAGTSPGRTFTVEWSHLQFFPADADEPNGDLSFQAVLHESGEIDLVWGDLRGPEADLACGASATVGIEAPGAAGGIRYSLGTCAIAARSAVRILPSGTVPSPRFLRGDANADGSVDISDPVAILFQLFSASPAIPCLEAADANDDGGLDTSDPIYLLTFLFLDGPAPVLPFDPLGDPARCGPDPVPHAGSPLGCESFAPCGTVGKKP